MATEWEDVQRAIGPPAATVDAQAVLAQAVAWHTGRGWRVETWGPGQAVLVHGHRANHVLHLLLSVFTLGLWLPVWLVLGLSSREVRQVLTVDRWGQVQAPESDQGTPVGAWVALGVLAVVVLAIWVG